MALVNELVSSIILAIIQGLTEWLPVSSKGHLILFESILHVKRSLMFEVALHFGTLMAVFVYFGRDIVDILEELLRGRWESDNGRLGLLVIVATLPAATVGFLTRHIFEISFENLALTAMGFAVTGIFLLICSFPVRRKKFTYGKAFTVGLAQIFALFPGISRSGTTIGTGLLTGLEERNAIKFSFLMSIPIIFGANVFVVGDSFLDWNLIWAALVSFVIGLGTIHLLYGKILVSRKNLKWFGIYALMLAFILGILLVV